MRRSLLRRHRCLRPGPRRRPRTPARATSSSSASRASTAPTASCAPTPTSSSSSTLPIERTELVEPEDGDVAEALAELRADDDVVSAEPDRPVTASPRPTTSTWNSLWGLDELRRHRHRRARGLGAQRRRGVTVAVVDTGINVDHEDLRARSRERRRQATEPTASTTTATAWSTTRRLGLRHRTTDPAGRQRPRHARRRHDRRDRRQRRRRDRRRAARRKVLPLRALDNNGSGWMSDIAAAFDYAGDLGVQIVNASLGGGYATALAERRSPPIPTRSTSSPPATTTSTTTTRTPPPTRARCRSRTCSASARPTARRPARAASPTTAPRRVDLFAPGVGILSAWHTAPSAYEYLERHLDGHAARRRRRRARAGRDARPRRTSQLKWALTLLGRRQARARRPVGHRRAPERRRRGRRDHRPGPGRRSRRPSRRPAPPPRRRRRRPSPRPRPPPRPRRAGPPASSPAPGTPVTPAPIADARAAPLRRQRRRLAGHHAQQAAGPLLALTRGDVRFTITRRGSKKPLASWTRRGRTGANSIALTRRLPTGRTLKPGTYTLAVALSATATTRGRCESDSAERPLRAAAAATT